VRKKLEEHGLLEAAKLHEVHAGETTTIGPFQDRVSACDAQHHRLRGAGDPHAGGRDHSHGRLQNGSHARGRQTFRSACLRAVRTGRRAGAFQRQHECGAHRFHAVREIRGGAHGGAFPRGAGKNRGFVLFKLRSSHPASDQYRAQRGTESRALWAAAWWTTSRSPTTLAN
jgi:hypothetical protein